MLTAYVAEGRGLRAVQPGADAPPPERLVWADLLEPTEAEEDAVERWLRIEVPTREEMREIEVSSRLYEENGAIYMTALLLSHADTDHPENSDATFILTRDVLVTVRYADPKPFHMFAKRACQDGLVCERAGDLYAGLMDAVVDRLADVLEKVGAEIDRVFRTVFARRVGKPMQNRDFEAILQRIGQIEDLSSKSRDSLVTVGRVISYFIGVSENLQISEEARTHLEMALRDVNQLTGHAAYQANKIAFLLDVTMGLINIEQNNIIKIFSVAAVALMPPTLVASIYGMNFKHMPELEWSIGYPLALSLMIVSAVVPYFYFRRKRWL